MSDVEEDSMCDVEYDNAKAKSKVVGKSLRTIAPTNPHEGDDQYMLREFLKKEGLSIEMLKLRTLNGDLLFIDSKPSLFYDVIGQMREVGYKQVYERLIATDPPTSRKSALFRLPMFDEARKIRLNELDCFQYKPKVKEGAQKCKKCGCTKTFKTKIQNRSGDEAITEIHVCSRCSTRWTI